MLVVAAALPRRVAGALGEHQGEDRWREQRRPQTEEDGGDGQADRVAAHAEGEQGQGRDGEGGDRQRRGGSRSGSLAKTTRHTTTVPP